MKRHKGLGIVAAVVGVLLIVVAVIYWAVPAKSLPSFFPGHQAGSSHIHTTHGLAAFIVGALLLILAWFWTGPGTGHTEDSV
jgi:amino acid transporter